MRRTTCDGPVRTRRRGLATDGKNGWKRAMSGLRPMRPDREAKALVNNKETEQPTFDFEEA